MSETKIFGSHTLTLSDFLPQPRAVFFKSVLIMCFVCALALFGWWTTLTPIQKAAIKSDPILAGHSFFSTFALAILIIWLIFILLAYSIPYFAFHRLPAELRVTQYEIDDIVIVSKNGAGITTSYPWKSLRAARIKSRKLYFQILGWRRPIFVPLNAFSSDDQARIAALLSGRGMETGLK